MLRISNLEYNFFYDSIAEDTIDFLEVIFDLEADSALCYIQVPFRIGNKDISCDTPSPRMIFYKGEIIEKASNPDMFFFYPFDSQRKNLRRVLVRIDMSMYNISISNIDSFSVVVMDCDGTYSNYLFVKF